MNIGGLFVHKLSSYQLALFSACLSCESKHVPAFVLFSGEMLDTGVNRCKIKLFMFCLFCHILPSNYLCGCKFWQKYETKTNKHGQSTNDQQSTNIQKSPNINKYQISTRPGLLLLFFFFCCTFLLHAILHRSTISWIDLKNYNLSEVKSFAPRFCLDYRVEIMNRIIFWVVPFYERDLFRRWVISFPFSYWLVLERRTIQVIFHCISSFVFMKKR